MDSDLTDAGRVEAMFRVLTPAEVTLVDELAGYISSQVRHQVPNIDDRVAADPEFALLVERTLAAAIVRVLRNPDGMRSYSIDDASFTRDSILSAGLLYLTEGELGQLRPVDGIAGAYVVGLGG